MATIILLFCKGVVFLFDLMYIFLDIFLVQIIIIMTAFILDRIGLFRWCISTLVFTAEGSRKKLFVHVIILVLTTSLFLNNLAAVLILTPIIINILRRLKFNNLEMLPFLWVCNLIPGIAGTISIIGNPISLISFELLDISLKRYTSIMFILCTTGIVVQTVLIFIYYKNYLKHDYSTFYIFNPDDEVIDWNGFNFGLFITFLMFIGNMIILNFSIPISIISIICLIIFMLYCIKNDICLGYVDILKYVPWKLLVCVSGICIIIFFVFINKLGNIISPFLQVIGSTKLINISLLSGLLSTLLSSLISNFSAIFIYIDAIKSSKLPIGSTEILAYSGILGGVIGAKFIPIGSISTAAWFNIIRLESIKFSWKEYIFSSIIFTLPILLLSLIILGIII